MLSIAKFQVSRRQEMGKGFRELSIQHKEKDLSPFSKEGTISLFNAVFQSLQSRTATFLFVRSASRHSYTSPVSRIERYTQRFECIHTFPTYATPEKSQIRGFRNARHRISSHFFSPRCCTQLVSRAKHGYTAFRLQTQIPAEPFRQQMHTSSRMGILIEAPDGSGFFIFLLRLNMLTRLRSHSCVRHTTLLRGNVRSRRGIINIPARLQRLTPLVNK